MFPFFNQDFVMFWKGRKLYRASFICLTIECSSFLLKISKNFEENSEKFFKLFELFCIYSSTAILKWISQTTTSSFSLSPFTCARNNEKNSNGERAILRNTKSCAVEVMNEKKYSSKLHMQTQSLFVSFDCFKLLSESWLRKTMRSAWLKVIT